MAVNVSGGALEFNASIDLTEFERSLLRIQNGLSNINQQQKKQSNDVDDWIKKASVAAAGFFSIQAAEGFISSLVQVRGQFQQIEIAFTTMLKSKNKADALMAQAVELAAVTPFTLTEVASGAKQLLAYGFAADDVTKNLETLGNIAAGVGSQLTDVVYLYGTLKASGRVTQMDINQFAGRGIPIYQALADVMKINVGQVRDYVSAGKVGFPQVEQAFKNLTSSGGQFFNLMKEQSKSLTGQLSNLEDAWDRMLNALGEDAEGILGGGIQTALKLIENYQEIIKIIEALIVAYGSYRAAIALTAVIQLSAAEASAGVTIAFKLQYLWTTILQKAQLALNAIMLANPYALVAAAIAGIATYMYLATDAAIKLKTAQELSAEAAKKQGDSVDTTQAKLTLYLSMIKNVNLSEGERLKIYDKIKEIDPSIVKGIDAKTVSYDKLKTGVDNYIASLREKLRFEVQESAIKESLKNEIALREQLDEKIKATDVYLEGNSRNSQKAKDLIADRGYLQDRVKEENVARDLLLKQQIETNKLIGNSVQSGTKEQIAAAKNDLAILQEQKTRYSKSSVEYMELQKQAVAKQEELNQLINVKAAEGAKAPPPVIKKNKAFYEAIVKDNTEKLEDLDKGAKDFAAQAAPLKKKIQDAQTALLSFGVNKNAQKQEDDAIQRKADILKKVYDLNTKYADQNLSDDKQALAGIREEYKTLKFEIDKYNANPKNKKISNNVIPAQQRALDNKQYEIDTKTLATELDKQKQLYADFEEYKKQFGTTKANEKYADDLKGYSTYLERLEAERAKVLEVDPLNMTGNQQARLKDLDKRINDEVSAQKAIHNALLVETSSYQDKVRVATETYNAKIALFQGDENIQRRKDITQNFQDEIDALADSNNQKMDYAKRLNEGVLVLTRKQIKEQIKLLKNSFSGEELPTAIKAQIDSLESRLSLSGGVDQANYDALDKRKEDLLKAIDAESKKATPNVTHLKEELLEVLKAQKLLDPDGQGKASTGGLGGFLSKLGDGNKLQGMTVALGDASQALGVLSTGLQDTNADAAYTLDTLAQLGGAAADLASSIISGDPQKIIQASIKAVGTLFSLAKKTREANAAARKEVEDFYAAAIKGEQEYQALLQQRAIDTAKNNKTAIDGALAEYAARQKQLAAFQKESEDIIAKLQGMSFIASEEYKHGTWLRKAKVIKTYTSLNGITDIAQLEQLLAQGKLEGDAKALVERLQELEKQGFDAKQAIADLAVSVQELFTGTTSDNLTDSFLAFVKAGKNGVDDIGKFFVDTMRESAESIFKNKILSGMVDKFYQDFADAAQSNDGIDENEFAILQAKFSTLTADAQKAYLDFIKLTGSGVDAPADENIKGALKRELTETTASEFLGITRASYDLNTRSLASNERQEGFLVQQNELSQRKLDVLLNIESNTGIIANNSKFLESMKISLEKLSGAPVLDPVTGRDIGR